MGKVQIRVEHALGRVEAQRRIRAAAEAQAEKGAKYVKSLSWSEGGAHVVGDGFEGKLAIGDTEVTGDVDLGWKLAFFPLKIQREAEAYLRELLR